MVFLFLLFKNIGERILSLSQFKKKMKRERSGNRVTCMNKKLKSEETFSQTQRSQLEGEDRAKEAVWE